MWIFTKYGFYSAVSARQGGPHGRKVDPTKVCVRARVRAHLAALSKRFPTRVPEKGISCDQAADYRWRVVLRKDVWANVLKELAREMEYDNFKGAVPSGDYHDVLHRVWSVMHGLQTRDEPARPRLAASLPPIGDPLGFRPRPATPRSLARPGLFDEVTKRTAAAGRDDGTTCRCGADAVEKKLRGGRYEPLCEDCLTQFYREIGFGTGGAYFSDEGNDEEGEINDFGMFADDDDTAQYRDAFGPDDVDENAPEIVRNFRPDR